MFGIDFGSSDRRFVEVIVEEDRPLKRGAAQRLEQYTDL